MAYVDDLVAQVTDPALQERLLRAVDALRKGRRFGLVFEDHVPETVMLPSIGVRPGVTVARRNDPDDPTGQVRYKVVNATDGQVKVSVLLEDGEVDPDSEEQVLSLSDLLVVQRFDEPVYPVLSHVGSVRRAPDKPSHLVLNGENFHAVQLLLFQHKGKVDCIYLDPPYNTGDSSWKYNNRFVDDNDTWRHSKWLSFMEKRLKLARELLADDGVLVVTIDEHEVHHLGMLLEDIFRDAYRQMVTIVTNPKGVTQSRFSRVEEYAHFCFLGGSAVSSIGDDLLTLGADDLERADAAGGQDKRPRWKGLLRSGTNARRVDRRMMFYPVLIDEDRRAVLHAGDWLPLHLQPEFDTKIDGLTPVWPVRKDGSLGNWGVGPTTLRQLIAKGYVSLGTYDPKRRSWGISYLSKEPQEQIAAGVLEVRGYDQQRNVVDVVYADPDSAARHMKTVWHRSRHDAGTGGTDVIRNLLGERAFSFPKSLYAVQDTLAALVGRKKDALIVDFFAGSGTTLHAAALLNTLDDGSRRCILVTNNELDEESEARLRADGVFPGDKEWEAEGVFESVTWPRLQAAVTGLRPNGTPVPGTYLGGRPYANGFEENVEAFRLDYAHRTDVELRRKFESVLPVLWMAAGAIGDVADIKPGAFMLLPDNSAFAVLLNEDHIAEFLIELQGRPDVRHVWLVTDSPQAFARMRSLVTAQSRKKRRKVAMLYKDYLRNFEVNARIAR